MNQRALPCFLLGFIVTSLFIRCRDPVHVGPFHSHPSPSSSFVPNSGAMEKSSYPHNAEEDESLENEQLSLLLSQQLRAIENSLKALNLSSSTTRMTTTSRNIIVSTWRSGSTFLGELLSMHPATFYHYEPLLHFRVRQARSGSGALAQEGLRTVKNLLNCNYHDLEKYVTFGKSRDNVFSHNLRLWVYCLKDKAFCRNPFFLSQLCSLFPFQVMKTVRLRLSLTQDLLRDPKLNVRILFLVRDPRGVMQSRAHRRWCSYSPDCSSPRVLCSDMEDDFGAAEVLRQEFPDRFMAIRYEDMSLHPFLSAKRILPFFRLTYTPAIQRFLTSHTSATLGGVSSTYRDSKSTPFKWKEYYESRRGELRRIQEDCRRAMELWGYEEMNTSHEFLNNSIPLRQPPWPDMQIF